MGSFLFIVFCSGLVLVASIALKTSPRWPARLMLAGSITSFIFTTLIIFAIQGISDDLLLSIFIFVVMSILGLILFAIGLMAYTMKTYAASKANKQLEYLNHQLQDQVAVQEKQIIQDK